MDIANIKAHTKTLDLVIPGTKKKIGLKMEIRSITSPESQAAVQANIDHRQQVLEAGDEYTVDMQTEAGVRLYASTVVSWDWADGASWGGEQLDFTPDNVMTVLSQDFILRQVMATAGKEANFFTEYAKTGKNTSATK